MKRGPVGHGVLYAQVMAYFVELDMHVRRQREGQSVCCGSKMLVVRCECRPRCCINLTETAPVAKHAVVRVTK